MTEFVGFTAKCTLCLIKTNMKSEEQRLIRSKKDTIYRIKQNKLAPSPYDNKRNVSLNRTYTKPWRFIFINNQ
ncbi:hypothetical protein NQ315_012807 [Exocentrus adspersus]|uniref:Uncharacterized protein n=1 Tax=Exocentrus adspersus TaxID=1586481 RepID=A0AAV8VBT2_9CUCU|nr:hypothetical protein NQ315_012807 [Exocentrus adspersus]